jgi:acyl carrier protein
MRGKQAMADKEEIVNDLKRILTQDLFVSIPENEINVNDSLADDLGLDSVGLVELTTILEDKYGIEIDGRAAASEELRTLDGWSNFILEKTKERGRSAVSETSA